MTRQTCLSLRHGYREANGVPVIIVSTSQNRDDTLHCMACGAGGYLAKHDEPKVLRYTIELVLHGGRYIPPQAAERAKRLSEPSEGGHGLSASQPTPAPFIERQTAVTADGSRRASRLTERQAVIWLLLAEAHSNKEIARRLPLSPSTVKSQVRGIYRKLGVQNRTQAALVAIREIKGE